MTKKFTAQVAQATKGVEYIAGGGGSMFDPGEIAEVVLPHLRGGQLFAYLFRRFGYPSVGWDDHKNLVTYCITTPMKDVFLYITPYMGSDSPNGEKGSYDSTSLMFGYCVPKSLEEEFYACLIAGGHASWPEHLRYQEVNQAFEEAMRDLLRPVYVRDVPINCYGKVNEDAEVPPHVEAYHAAGYPIPRVFFKSTERWEQFTDALVTLGGGSMEKGIDAVIKAAATVKLYEEKSK